MNTSTIKVTAPPMEPPTIRSNILSSSRYQNKRTQTKSLQNVLTKTREDKKKGDKNKPMLINHKQQINTVWLTGVDFTRS